MYNPFGALVTMSNFKVISLTVADPKLGGGRQGNKIYTTAFGNHIFFNRS